MADYLKSFYRNQVSTKYCLKTTNLVSTEFYRFQGLDEGSECLIIMHLATKGPQTLTPTPVFLPLHSNASLSNSPFISGVSGLTSKNK